MLSKFRQASDYYLGEKLEIKISFKVDDGHLVLTEGPAMDTVAKYNLTKTKSWGETPGFAVLLKRFLVVPRKRGTTTHSAIKE